MVKVEKKSVNSLLSKISLVTYVLGLIIVK